MNDRARHFPHHMLREIYEQPEALRATLAAYCDKGALRRDAFAQAATIFSTAGRLTIAASGSSRHAGLVGKVLFEQLAGLGVDVVYASEYADRGVAAAALDCADCVLVLSQSGETADTLEALRVAGRGGAKTLAITNNAGSTMEREADCAFTTRAGLERAIPASKSFTTQLAMLYLLALCAGTARGRSTAAEGATRIAALGEVAGQIETSLPEWERETARIAAALGAVEACLFLGRDLHLPIAAEGALKLKESAYVQAEAYPAGEFKHGPAALLSARVALVALATVDRAARDSVARYRKTLALLGDLREFGSPMVAVACADDAEAAQAVWATVFVPAADDLLLPLLEVVPLQLFCYAMAVRRGVDVDRPRHLTKAVLQN